MKNYLIAIFSVLFFSSCCIQGKIEEAKKVVTEGKAIIDKDNSNVSSINGLSLSKILEGKIDSIILQLIARRLLKFEGNIGTAGNNINIIEALLNNKGEFRKKYKSVIRPMLDSIKQNIAQYSDRLKLYMMIGDGLNIANFKLFDLAAFFGPGKYAVPEDKRESASASFSPIVDSIITFSDKYKDIPRSGTLIVLGFADGTGFSPGPLYDFLAGKIGKTEATKEELNQQLSELRAEELISILSGQFVKKSSTVAGGSQALKINYFGKGKGEGLPLPTIKDYQVNDERRRIVLCYWAVLPD
jgi:hypothetical protein